jgi:Glycosyltransferase
MKKVLLYLSMKPSDGGKFQYSINILDALSQLSKREGITLVVVFKETAWKEHITLDYIVHSSKPSFFEKKIKGLILNKLGLVAFWRLIGKFLDPVQRLFYSINPDMIFYPGNDSLAYECSIASVIPIYDLMHRYEPRFTEVGEERIYAQREFHYKNVCRYAKFILVDSKLGKEHVLESYRCEAEKIIVLPYAPPRYVYESVDMHILDKYDLPDRFILYPAQFWSHKNHIAIVHALCILRDKYATTIHAVFVGSTKNAFNDIQQKIIDYQLTNQIKILGYVQNNELVALYKRAEALVFPSYFGPTNIPPLEAAILGCPVILSDIYAHREILGDGALYFDPYNAEELARQIKYVYKHENKQNILTLTEIASSKIFDISFYVDLLKNTIIKN